MIRFGICCRILVQTPLATAQEKAWSERFPLLAQRISHLDRRLTAEDAEIRKRVLSELTYFRPRDSNLYPPFFRALLTDPSPEVRGMAIERLWEHQVFPSPRELPDSFQVPFVGDFRWKNPIDLARVRGLARHRDVPEGGRAIHALSLVSDADAIALARDQLDSKNDV